MSDTRDARDEQAEIHNEDLEDVAGGVRDDGRYNPSFPPTFPGDYNPGFPGEIEPGDFL